MRKKGLTKAEKRGDRETREGLVESYIHDGRLGAIVEVNCETSFVAKTDEFKTLAHQIAMQIASMNPLYVSESDIPEADREAKIKELEAENNRKSADITSNNKSMVNFRAFIENSKIYMDTYKYSQNYEKSKNQERYYQEHDSELNAYAHAIEMLNRTNMDLSLLRDKTTGQNFIKGMQEKLQKLEEINSIHEQDIKNNQKEISELRKIQKELDIYHNRNNDTIS